MKDRTKNLFHSLYHKRKKSQKGKAPPEGGRLSVAKAHYDEARKNHIEYQTHKLMAICLSKKSQKGKAPPEGGRLSVSSWQ